MYGYMHLHVWIHKAIFGCTASPPSPYSFACVCGSIPIRLVYVGPAAYSASAGARASAWWLTAARLQVARIHECIAATALACCFASLLPNPAAALPPAKPATNARSCSRSANCCNLAEDSVHSGEKWKAFWRWGKMLGETLDTDEQATCRIHLILTEVAAGKIQSHRTLSSALQPNDF